MVSACRIPHVPFCARFTFFSQASGLCSHSTARLEPHSVELCMCSGGLPKQAPRFGTHTVCRVINKHGTTGDRLTVLSRGQGAGVRPHGTSALKLQRLNWQLTSPGCSSVALASSASHSHGSSCAGAYGGHAGQIQLPKAQHGSSAVPCSRSHCERR